jgi:hypothetical protein
MVVSSHEYDESHVVAVPLEDIPKHTWEIKTRGVSKIVVGHMLLRPTESVPAWQLVDFVDVDDGWRVEQTVDLFAEEDVESVIYIRSDGSRCEVSLKQEMETL